jgi:hypothetical protein
MTALAPRLDEWALATLDALAEHYAAKYGDADHTEQRQALLLADLRAHDTRPASNRAAWQRRQAQQAATEVAA